MPLICADVEDHDGVMTTHRLPRIASSGYRPWDRWLTRVSAPSLDGKLAAGYREGTSRVLAFRAQQICSPGGGGGGAGGGGRAGGPPPWPGAPGRRYRGRPGRRCAVIASPPPHPTCRP